MVNGGKPLRDFDDAYTNDDNEMNKYIQYWAIQVRVIKSDVDETVVDGNSLDEWCLNWCGSSWWLPFNDFTDP